jgi:hypothetical protein
VRRKRVTGGEPRSRTCFVNVPRLRDRNPFELFTIYVTSVS